MAEDDLSPRQRLAQREALGWAARIDSEEREHFRTLPRRIVDENARIVEQLNQGRVYVANPLSGSTMHVIHFATCPAIRHQIDRDIAHATEIALHEDEVARGKPYGSWHAGTGHDPVAKWPQLMSQAEVESLRSYRRCGTCNPDTVHAEKRYTRPPTPSKITSVTHERIGREYETPGGEYLGELESILIERNHITLNCSERSYRGTAEALVVLLPKPQA